MSAVPFSSAAAFFLIGVAFGGELLSCGYHFSARPDLPPGVTGVRVEVFESEGSESALGVQMAAAFEARIRQDDRSGGGEGSAVLRGRVSRPSTNPTAFPPGFGGAGLYTEILRVELRLYDGSGRELARERLSELADFEAGEGPERTESNRKRATARAILQLADRGWRELLEKATTKAPVPSPNP